MAGAGLFWVGQQMPEGMVAPGNIDLAARPVVRNRDGSISTIRSISIQGPEGAEYLIPTVSEDGRVMTDREAVKRFQGSGKHLGVFASPDLATAYAKALHDQQALMYKGGGDVPAAAR